jgi:fucose permease
VKTTSPKILVALACFGFLIYGLFNSSVGPVLNELSILTNTSLAAVGGVLTFLFAGSLTAMILVGPIIDRVGQKYVLLVSLALLALGILGYSNVHSLPLMFALFLMAGLGQGGMEIASNLVITDAYPRNNTGVLNLLHFFFGLGAFLGPALVSLSLTLGAQGRLVHWCAAAAFVLLGVLFLLVYRNAPRPKEVTQAETATANAGLYRTPLLWMFGAVLLLYVGVEFSIGSWATSFMGISAGLSIEQGALVTSAYWGFLTLGRLFGIFISKKLSAVQLLGTSVIGALLGGVAFLLLTGSTAPVIAAVMGIGFFFGAIFPTTVSLTTAAFPNHQGKAVSLVSAMSSIGGLALPWLGGVLLEKGGATVFSIYAVVIIGLLVLFFTLIRRSLGKNVNCDS